MPYVEYPTDEEILAIEKRELERIHEKWEREARGIRAVERLGICTLLEELFPGYFDKPWDWYDYEKERKAVVAWCEEHNYHYYAMDREGFSEWVACREAWEAGKVGVVLEDLS